MKKRVLSIPLTVGAVSLRWGASWLLAAPIAAWAIARIFAPVLGPTLSTAEDWIVAALILVGIGLSLVAHALAHAGAVRFGAISSEERQLPSDIPLYPFGDAAQVWPAAASARREVAVVLAGPATSLVLAVLAYRVYDGQLHPYANLVGLFLAIFNGAVAALNLAPGFPLDGGRLLRALLWGLLARPALATRMGALFGLVMVIGLVGWGVVLIGQGVRFGSQTGAATIVAAGVLLLGLVSQRPWAWDRPAPKRRYGGGAYALRLLTTVALVLAQLCFLAALLPTNNGLRAPGAALSVEPMVRAPSAQSYGARGTFILTSVVPQTPIIVAQWVQGQLNPAIDIVPPEQIVPHGTTPQELARQGSQMLLQSESVAMVVGLQLAGYDAAIVQTGVQVASVMPESPALGILQPGDEITTINGAPVQDLDDLSTALAGQTPGATVQLTVRREGALTDVAVPLMPPAEAGSPPRIGITVAPSGFDVELPFPVEIVPERIVGGPSAGLMFTLTVYNRVTPEDLTGGYRIAGTGTINLDGGVGPIGGVRQKVAAAERAGATYFLSPPENYPDALAVARRIQVIEISSAEEAITFLRSLPPRS
jgi:PDZ domain-containing protein